VTTLPSKTNTTANIGVQTATILCYSAHIKRFILKKIITGKQSKSTQYDVIMTSQGTTANK